MPKKENKDKWYNNVFVWAMAILIILIFVIIAININDYKPRSNAIIDKSAIEQPLPRVATTIQPDKITFDKSVCEKSCITRTHYFSNNTRKLICVPLKDMGACEEIDD